MKGLARDCVDLAKATKTDSGVRDAAIIAGVQHIALLTPEKLRDLWLHHPSVNEVVSFAPGEGVFSVGRRLRGQNFDLALVLPNSPRSALEVWLARVPQRVGYARPWRNWFLTQLVQERAGAVTMRKRSITEIKDLMRSPTRSQSSNLDPQPASAHHIHQYLHLTAALGANPGPVAPRLVVTEAEMAAAKNKFALADANDDQRCIVDSGVVDGAFEEFGGGFIRINRSAEGFGDVLSQGIILIGEFSSAGQ